MADGFEFKCKQGCSADTQERLQDMAFMHLKYIHV